MYCEKGLHPSVSFRWLIKTKALQKGMEAERSTIRSRRKDSGAKNGRLRERGNHRH